MKVGDLLTVRYIITDPFDQSFEDWGEQLIGILVETPDSRKHGVYRMWCLSSESMHILMPSRDFIKVISESR